MNKIVVLFEWDLGATVCFPDKFVVSARGRRGGELGATAGIMVIWATCIMSETFGRLLLEAAAVAEGLSIKADAKCTVRIQSNQAGESK